MEDQSGQIDRATSRFNTSPGLLTLVLAIASVGTYFSVRQKAIKEARDVVQTLVRRTWKLRRFIGSSRQDTQ